MSTSTFASIDVGSNEVSLKIYELGKKNNIRELTYVRHIMELGSDTYVNGYISNHMIDELCDVLDGFIQIMKDFGVTEYRACSTSSIREAANRHSLLDRVRTRTGIDINILSNSEQYFLQYQGATLREPLFNDIINAGALVVEVGSGSSQVTCFSGGKLVVSHNLRLGALRINEFLSSLERESVSYDDLLSEYIDGDIYTSYKIYFHKYKIKTVLGIGDGIRPLLKYLSLTGKLKDKAGSLSAGEMTSAYKSLFEHSVAELADMLGTSEEQARLLLPTAMIYEKIMRINNAQSIYLSTTDLCDGIFAQYAIKKGLISRVRDFDKDVLSAARKIALRYNSNSKHTTYVEKLALKIFDSMNSISGLDKRDRLLLQVAVRLHDCGAYVNFEDVASNSYKIITSTEIIGLTRKENVLVANIVGNPVKTFPTYDQVRDVLTEREYIKVAKLSSIFRIANDLDTSKNQKLSLLNLTLKNNKLTISGESLMNCALEQAFFKHSAAFFEQTFGIVPVIKIRRMNNG